MRALQDGSLLESPRFLVGYFQAAALACNLILERVSSCGFSKRQADPMCKTSDVSERRCMRIFAS